jgi:hypothetical protein
MVGVASGRYIKVRPPRGRTAHQGVVFWNVSEA